MADVEAAARLSAEHLSCLVKLTEAWLKRQDGLTTDEKILITLTADIQHIKALHLVIQLKLPMEKRGTFSTFLRQLAETEEKEEEMQKGGAIPPAAPK